MYIDIDPNLLSGWTPIFTQMPRCGGPHDATCTSFPAELFLRKAPLSSGLALQEES